MACYKSEIQALKDRLKTANESNAARDARSNIAEDNMTIINMKEEIEKMKKESVERIQEMKEQEERILFLMIQAFLRADNFSSALQVTAEIFLILNLN